MTKLDIFGFHCYRLLRRDSGLAYGFTVSLQNFFKWLTSLIFNIL